MGIRLLNPINPVCRVTLGSSQSIANATTTLILFDTEAFDSHGMWAVASAGNIYVPQAGIYAVSMTLVLAANGTGVRQLNIRKNGINPRVSEIRVKADSSDQQVISATGIIDMQPGDYVSAYVYQESGGALNLVSDTANKPSLSVWKVSDLVVP